MSAHLGQRLYATVTANAHAWRRANPLPSFSLDTAIGSRYFSASSSSSATRAQSVRDALTGGWIRRISRSAPRNAFSKTTARRFASGGFLVLGTSPSSTATATAAVESGTKAATGTIKKDKPACFTAQTKFERRSVRNLAYKAWRRSLHTQRSDGNGNGNGKRNGSVEQKSATPESGAPRTPASDPTRPESELVSTQAAKDQINVKEPLSFSHNFVNRLPHRPTKEELLAAATGFWSRLKVRFKWFSIRSVRPFNVDEIGAFFSWFLLGHVLWVVLGTTTFFSLLIFAINTVFAQGRFPPFTGNFSC